MAGRWVVRGAGHGFHSGCVMRVAGRHDVHAENPGDKPWRQYAPSFPVTALNVLNR